MKNTLKKLTALLLILSVFSCKNGENGGDSGPDLTPGNLNNKRLILVESNNTNSWIFKADASDTQEAFLEGVGTFSFTYTITSNNTSTLIFNVSGNDQYKMTWTSETEGSFEQSFNGQAGSSGTFKIEDASGTTGSVSFLSLEQKFNGAITQPKVTLTGNLANDFEVLNAGYWESGNTIKFVNGIITLRYLKNNSVTPTAIVARLKDGQGNDIGLKIPVVNSSSETQYTISGASTFLKNTSPLSFSFNQEVNLGGGASVSGTVNSPNNNVYAQGVTGKNVLNLIQFLRQGSSHDFRGNFGDLAEIELFYFTQTEGINNSNAFVVQRYFDNNGSAVSQPTGKLEITEAPSYNSSTEKWIFKIKNTSSMDVTGSFDFLLQSSGTGVGYTQEFNIDFSSGETRTFEIAKSSIYRSLNFLSSTQIDNLETRILLDW